MPSSPASSALRLSVASAAACARAEERFFQSEASTLWPQLRRAIAGCAREGWPEEFRTPQGSNSSSPVVGSCGPDTTIQPFESSAAETWKFLIRMFNEFPLTGRQVMEAVEQISACEGFADSFRQLPVEERRRLCLWRMGSSGSPRRSPASVLALLIQRCGCSAFFPEVVNREIAVRHKGFFDSVLGFLTESERIECERLLGSETGPRAPSPAARSPCSGSSMDSLSNRRSVAALLSTSQSVFEAIDRKLHEYPGFVFPGTETQAKELSRVLGGLLRTLADRECRLVIAGPAKSGKSTLARWMSGMIPIRSSPSTLKVTYRNSPGSEPTLIASLDVLYTLTCTDPRAMSQVASNDEDGSIRVTGRQCCELVGNTELPDIYSLIDS